MKKFILGIYDNINFTKKVISSLKSAGIPASSISLIAKDNLVHGKDRTINLDDIEGQSIDDVNQESIDLSEYKADIDNDKILLAVDEAFEAKAYQAKQNFNSQVVDEEPATPIEVDADTEPADVEERTANDYLSDSSYYDQGEQARKGSEAKEKKHNGISDVKRPVTQFEDQNRKEKRYTDPY